MIRLFAVGLWPLVASLGYSMFALFFHLCQDKNVDYELLQECHDAGINMKDLRNNFELRQLREAGYTTLKAEDGCVLNSNMVQVPAKLVTIRCCQNSNTGCPHCSITNSTPQIRVYNQVSTTEEICLKCFAFRLR